MSATMVQAPVHSAEVTACPVCGERGTLFRSAEGIARDLAQTEEQHAGDGRFKLMRVEAVDVAGCDSCGTLWRADADVWRSAERDYEGDTYDPGLLRQLHEDEVEMARRDARWLVAQGVRPGHRLLEVACYVGAFLTFAGEQGANVTGVDPNDQLVTWCRSLGLDARQGVMDEMEWGDQRFDGVWILNCFDQVPAPARLLDASCRLLRPGGRLVIRTPNAAFVRAAYEGAPSLRARAREHALWGMPHLCCYTVASLATLVRDAGFSVDAVRSRPSDDGGREDGSDPPWFDLTAVAD